MLDPTDSFFLESGRELIEKNQYLLPLNNYVPWLDKPILFFWMVVLSYKCFGISPFVGRLPAALSAIGAALIIFFGCRPILKPRIAALAALIFLSTPLVSIVGHICLTDMTLCALIAGSILFLFKGLEFKSKRDLFLGYFFLALAVLCKGPISIILCGLAFLPYLLLSSRSKAEFLQQILALHPLVGAAIVMALNLPWYVLATITTKGEFLVAFFWTQNFGRMVGTVNHQEPFYFYIPAFFGGFFPWCLLGLTVPGFLRKALSPAKLQASKLIRLSALNLFWFLGVIILFSAIKTKLPTYILPCAPAFAILVAMQMPVLARSAKVRRLIAPLLLITIVFTGGMLIHPLLKGYAREIIAQHLWLLIPVGACLIGAWFGLIRKDMKVFAVALTACALVGCGVMVPRGLKVFFEQRQAEFNLLACRARDDGASVAMIFAEEPSVPWFTHRPVSRLMAPEDALSFLKQTPPPHYVLVQTGLASRLSWFPGTKTTLARSKKWFLIKIDRSDGEVSK